VDEYGCTFRRSHKVCCGVVRSIVTSVNLEFISPFHYVCSSRKCRPTPYDRAVGKARLFSVFLKAQGEVIVCIYRYFVSYTYREVMDNEHLGIGSWSFDVLNDAAPSQPDGQRLPPAIEDGTSLPDHEASSTLAARGSVSGERVESEGGDADLTTPAWEGSYGLSDLGRAQDDHEPFPQYPGELSIRHGSSNPRSDYHSLSSAEEAPQSGYTLLRRLCIGSYQSSGRASSRGEKSESGSSNHSRGSIAPPKPHIVSNWLDQIDNAEGHPDSCISPTSSKSSSVVSSTAARSSDNAASWYPPPVLQTQGSCRCDCGKTFDSVGSLRRHKRMAPWECPFKCHLCSRVFDDEIELGRHLHRVHKLRRSARASAQTTNVASTINFPKRMDLSTLEMSIWRRRKHRLAMQSDGVIHPLSPEPSLHSER